MSDGTDVGKGESMWNAWETVVGETVAAKDRQNIGGRDDASKRDAVKGQSEWPWFAKYHILHKQNSWPSCVHQLSYHPFGINPSKSPLFGQMKSSCSCMFTMIFPWFSLIFPCVSIGLGAVRLRQRAGLRPLRLVEQWWLPFAGQSRAQRGAGGLDVGALVASSFGDRDGGYGRFQTFFHFGKSSMTEILVIICYYSCYPKINVYSSMCKKTST